MICVAPDTRALLNLRRRSQYKGQLHFRLAEIGWSLPAINLENRRKLVFYENSESAASLLPLHICQNGNGTRGRLTPQSLTICCGWELFRFRLPKTEVPIEYAGYFPFKHHVRAGHTSLTSHRYAH